jgi:multiple sugar transport system permease protein
MNDRITLREQLAGMAFAAPYLIGVAAFLVFPLAMSLYYSFCNYSIWIGWTNYRHLLTDHAFHTALWNTIFYAAISVPFTLALSLLLAILLNQPTRGQGIYRTIVFLPSLVPLVASALIWQWLFNADKGLINSVLRPVLHMLGKAVLSPLAGALGADQATIESLRHISPPVWLGDPHWAMAAIIFISFWGVGQTVVIFLAGLQDVPRELHEAAEMDGAGAIHRFFNITLPMLSPVIFFNLIMGIIGSWQIFDVPYVMTGGGPGRSTLFYSMYIFEAAFNQLRMGPACAMAWIQLLIILFLTVLAFASARKWVYYA